MTNAVVRSHGRLVIVGGGEDREHERRILRRFVDLAGGAAARIVVVGTATTDPQGTEEMFSTAFADLAAEVVFLAIGTRDEANDPEVLSTLAKATGVYFTGGDQMRIATIFGGSEADVLVHSMAADGVVIGGTSAGAAMMSSTMILGGSDTVPDVGAVRLGPGLEFVAGMLIDMHFAERGRIARLLSAVAQFPHELGVGIDEDTALIVDGHAVEVIGSGAVTIIDAGRATTQITDHGPIAMTGVRMHVLPSGFAFDLATREPRPLLDESRPDHATDQGNA